MSVYAYLNVCMYMFKCLGVQLGVQLGDLQELDMHLRLYLCFWCLCLCLCLCFMFTNIQYEKVPDLCVQLDDLRKLDICICRQPQPRKSVHDVKCQVAKKVKISQKSKRKIRFLNHLHLN